MDAPEWTLPLIEPMHWAPLAQTSAPVSLPPDIDAQMDPSQLKAWVEDALHKAEKYGTFAEVASMFMKHGRLAVAAELAGQVGMLATIFAVPLIMYNTFTTHLRVAEQKGFSFGIMWEALHLPDQELRSPFGINMSDVERQAFADGVQQGREKFREDAQLRQAVVGTIVYEYTQQTKDSFTTPEHRALNRIWEKVHEDNPGLRNTHLDMQNPGYQYTPAVPDK